MADESELYKTKSKIPNETNKVNAVREEYKRYKKRIPPPDFSDVIDFENSQTFRGRVKVISLSDETFNCPSSGFISNPREWNVFEILSCPGFFFIVNPFRTGVQHYFVQRSLKDFPSKPNITNLDGHKGMILPEGGSIWGNSKNSDNMLPNLIDRLRWTHLGYQFDYNNEEYKPETYYGFPKDLASLTCHIARALGYPNYRPESGVVNYYPLGSSMGGHVDKYENDLSQPLVSISFGQSAVYLIGGKTNDVRPTALFVKSGDIIVMTKESRLAYHAVPCIVKVGIDIEPPQCLKWNDCVNNEDTTLSGELCGQNYDLTTVKIDCPVCDKYHDHDAVSKRQQKFAKNQQEWEPFVSYLARTRININVRQVHKPQENVQLHLV